MILSADESGSEAAREYRLRLEAHRTEEVRAGARARRLSVARLVVFLSGTGVGGLALAGWVTGHVLWVFLAAFAGLVVWHQRTLHAGWQARRLKEISERGLARIEDRWAGGGESGHAYRPAGHVFADDLDLFGRGSLFERLCTARTAAGRERLAGWLLEAASPLEARRRQEAVAELRGAVDLREQMALLGGEASSALDRAAASAWGEAPSRLGGPLLGRGARVLGLASAVLAGGWALGGWSVIPLLAVLVAQFLWTVPYWTRVETVLAAADRPSQDLALVGGLLGVLETLPARAFWLQDLAARLAVGGAGPSRHIARLVRLMDFVDARRNQVFLPVSWLFCLGTQLAVALESWRDAHGRDFVGWVDAVGSFEAIVALSAYAYENPGDPFPVLEDEGTLYEARALGHPLLGRAACVRNDVVLRAPPGDGTPQALLVSGSNMSGKSTLLRSVGVNAVLARAGAPVRAAALRLGPLALGASIRIQDSLQAGESRFYAEIARLRKIVDLARENRPVLFLVDEMLHGTNSHDRRIGAQAVIRTLLEAQAIGLVTTHDLALAEIAERDRRMANVHFEDRIEDGRILFDYRLHAGVVTHSNAIALMRSVGLDV